MMLLALTNVELQTVLTRLLVGGGVLCLAVIAALGLRHELDRFHRFVQETPKGQRFVLALLEVNTNAE